MKIIVPKCTNPISSVALISFILCSLFVFFDYSALYESRTKEATFLTNDFPNSSFISSSPNPCIDKKPTEEAIKALIPSSSIDQKPIETHNSSSSISRPARRSRKRAVHGRGRTRKAKAEDSSCQGKFIYIHNLPKKFNEDLVQNCKLPHMKWSEVCKFVWHNMGLGPEVQNNSLQDLTNRGWFYTSQFSLEVIFHHRMKQYKCLTKDSSKAAAIFVPFYAGLDVGPYLWGFNISVRDKGPIELAKWLSQRPEWKAMWGRDHFLIGGRIAWDYRRHDENDSDWGSKLMFLPELNNTTMLTIETAYWNNDIAIPYPTDFHPSRDSQIIDWQRKVTTQKRPFLFSFVGGTRPKQETSIRGELINQCKASKNCFFLACISGENKCSDPATVMNTFMSSVFCLQPPGDSFTRRSMFDAILAGCIPVLFHPGTAYGQYNWYFPKDHQRYSVFIPSNKIKAKEVNVSEVLERISSKKILEMREEVVKMIPRVIYADPRSRLEHFEDGFDVAVKRILERVKRVRKVIEEGKDPSVGFSDINLKKFEMVGFT
ncbi:probable xyloglucan galactosyltransferase GT12 [Cucurbita pepo subsp. pepo]|uniref:probable xyloglucan galactosyltransferase GT12 n=1 Tax=Cucurbita pepo subsp. pepo TaxID=3664 RepID=UPI000C9D64EE|nr:probable xyloglucan galactosyltransferase GT12 [Cucurbita pepo subsp. pepo]